MLNKRLERLQAALRANNVDVAALLPGASLQHLTGVSFHAYERALVGFVRAAGEPVFVVPAMEGPRFEHNPPFPLQYFAWDDTNGPAGAFEQATRALGLGAGSVIGVDPLGMRYHEMRLIEQAAPGVTFEAAGEALAAVRRNKDAAEIDRLRRAIAITETALARALEQCRPGMTEREIGALVQVEIIKGGGVVGFILVQGGESASNPHGDMSDRPVAAGEGMLIDFGAVFEGYSADLTRTFVMGGAAAAPRFREIFELVEAANAAGRAACGPGAIPQEVDRAARKVIDDGGYGEWFLHRTGHGLGLDLHEDPYITEGNTRPLEVGEVFTIEPGIYVPGLGGVRIEDNMVVTEDGAACLTSFPRGWRVIGE